MGETPFFATGIGITPDFAFPIISPDSPIPNSKTQAIVYANGAGFSRARDVNSAADTENYIALKFANEVSDKRKNEIISKLRTYLNSKNS